LHLKYYTTVELPIAFELNKKIEKELKEISENLVSLRKIKSWAASNLFFFKTANNYYYNFFGKSQNKKLTSKT
jgi:hypothetical protein